MKLGIMQPYFFPYLGYFALIKYTDKWIVFDNVQYIKHGWINRNRIIHPLRCESMYIAVPIKKAPQTTNINEIMIDTSSNWKERMLSQLRSSYEKRAPFYKETMEVVNYALNIKTDYISELNVYCMQQICKYLDIPFNFEIFRKMNLLIDDVSDPGEWALNISKALSVDEYVNPPGGQDLFDKSAFKAENIDLKFLQIKFTPYNQRKSSFIEGLSIIDTMMFNTKQKINNMLENYELIF